MALEHLMRIYKQLHEKLHAHILVIADADVLLTVAADMMERLGEHLGPEQIEPELVARLREGVELIERRSKARP